MVLNSCFVTQTTILKFKRKLFDGFKTVYHNFTCTFLTSTVYKKTVVLSCGRSRTYHDTVSPLHPTDFSTLYLRVVIEKTIKIQ